jgi:filamentous hemagglutinin family protein
MKISLVVIFCIGYMSTTMTVQAQITQDLSQSTPTNIAPQNSENIIEISGGTQAGINLFHSFDTFTIPEGSTAVFLNNYSSVQNVIGRVTGSTSDISGTIKAAGNFPVFNLFLVNPKGIIFGPNAKIDIQGSFIATTSNAIKFGDQGIFQALDPSDPSMLTISPTAFFFDQIRPQSTQSSIASQASIMVLPGKSILLLGGNIELTGGGLTAENGRIELDSLTGSGFVELNISGQSGEILSLGFPNGIQRGDISLTNGAFVDVRDSGAGSIAINAKNIKLSGDSFLFAGINSGKVADINTLGAIVLNATKEIEIKDEAGIANIAFRNSIGNSGDISLTAESLILKNDTALESTVFGKGNAGNIEIKAQKELVLSNLDGSGLSPQILSGVAGFVEGNSGEIKITAGSISLSDGSIIRSTVLGIGNSSNISIHADNFILIKDSNNYTTQITTAINPGAIGNAGNIDISARTLFLTSGGRLSSAILGPEGTKPGGEGKGGNITIHTSDSVIISGIGTNGSFSGIFANAEGDTKGLAGDISITTNFLKISAGAEVKLSNLQGQAGNLFVNADFLTLDKGKIISETGGAISSRDANINLAILNLLKIENESLISANASTNANGGNIKIDTPILLALPPTGLDGSDIRANADFGKGGNITINSQGIFGIEQRKANSGNQTNDIDASSQFGQSGQVQINTTTDPNQGLVELPATVVDPSTLVAQNPCTRASSSEFTRSGRGGLPPSLSQDLNSESTQVGLVEPTHLSAATPEPKSASKETSPLPLASAKIVPAQGWVYNAKGEVVLVAYNSAVTGPQRLQSTPAGCPVF